MKTYADLTDFPRLFCKTYWGSFDANNANQEIIKNRNAFANEHKITKNIKKPYLSMTEYPEYDHLEFYKTALGEYVVVNSPYRIIDEFMRGAGFKRLHYKLYSSKSVSYVRIFVDLAAFNAWIRLHNAYQ